MEHAAWMYERLGLLEKAGELRRADRTRVVREERISENTRRVVTVDLNKLIAEARQQGLAIPLKCPQCGSVLRLPLSDSGPLRCAYCGTYLDTQTAVRLLGQALGHG